VVLNNNPYAHASDTAPAVVLILKALLSIVCIFVVDQSKAGAFWNVRNFRRAKIPERWVLFFRGGASGR